MTQLALPSVTSIVEADEFIAGHSDAVQHAAIIHLNAFEVDFWNKSLSLRRLLLLKRLFRSNPAVETRFRERRDIHLQAIGGNDEPSRVHLFAYVKAFSLINRANGGCFGGGKVHRFLDLGCSPGGFSSYVLKHNWGAQGVGVTLPDEEDRIPVQIDSDLLANYDVRYTDVVAFVARSTETDTPPAILAHDGSPVRYDLVIAGAFPVLQGAIPWWRRTQLVFAQLILIFANISKGGSAIVAINTKAFLWTVDVIGMLRQCFETVTAHKTGRLHAVRTSCYLVCRGFRATSEEVDRFTGRLHGALLFLAAVPMESSQDDNGRWEYKHGPEDTPLVSGQSAAEIFTVHHRFVLDLFEPLWEVQYNAIRVDLAGVLVDLYGAEAGIPKYAESDGFDSPTDVQHEAVEHSLATSFRPWPHRQPTASPDDYTAHHPDTIWRSRGRGQAFSQSGQGPPEGLFGRRRSQTSAANSSSTGYHPVEKLWDSTSRHR
ncbi:hypothetical protein IEO21_07608 [Rhodonia placenta]|uniref:Ribosomal RNA methyltransferase FtsJ domain-containing protein n=1 Tax=Rhodonia placenta TaxID=104341 RepID=A0A8H7NXR0_9APHY|nr:hypothetical protein IEO21_07608 [Postia placenta]